eukprot:m.76343 g.76343  ORF g.76343 m.76343 type:complete len:382 (+) comp8108_c0_seq4:3357-4502(+)
MAEHSAPRSWGCDGCCNLVSRCNAAQRRPRRHWAGWSEYFLCPVSHKSAARSVGRKAARAVPNFISLEARRFCRYTCSCLLDSLVDAVGLVTAFTETEKEMVAVERIEHCCNVPQEPDAAPAVVPPLVGWPRAGAIFFDNVVFCYKEGAVAALRGVSMNIPGGCRVGIAGRSGAGKTSLLQALFRMNELSGGRIVIDGVDCSRIPKKILRSNLAIIPQDPMLFSGSVRDNLDPLNKFSDEEVWTALRRCALEKFVQSLEDGLEANVSERGSNFSAGQKQLLCLGRALLQQCKIICIDEATANVDMETDAFVQEVMRTQFVGCTVLTIAHRVETIIDSDLVILMHQGRVLEHGRPDDLLARESAFRAMVHVRRQSTQSPEPA